MRIEEVEGNAFQQRAKQLSATADRQSAKAKQLKAQAAVVAAQGKLAKAARRSIRPVGPR